MKLLTIILGALTSDCSINFSNRLDSLKTHLSNLKAECEKVTDGLIRAKSELVRIPKSSLKSNESAQFKVNKLKEIIANKEVEKSKLESEITICQKKTKILRDLMKAEEISSQETSLSKLSPLEKKEENIRRDKNKSRPRFFVDENFSFKFVPNKRTSEYKPMSYWDVLKNLQNASDEDFTTIYLPLLDEILQESDYSSKKSNNSSKKRNNRTTRNTDNSTEMIRCCDESSSSVHITPITSMPDESSSTVHITPITSMPDESSSSVHITPITKLPDESSSSAKNNLNVPLDDMYVNELLSTLTDNGLNSGECENISPRSAGLPQDSTISIFTQSELRFREELLREIENLYGYKLFFNLPVINSAFQNKENLLPVTQETASRRPVPSLDDDLKLELNRDEYMLKTPQKANHQFECSASDSNSPGYESTSSLLITPFKHEAINQGLTSTDIYSADPEESVLLTFREAVDTPTRDEFLFTFLPMINSIADQVRAKSHLSEVQ